MRLNQGDSSQSQKVERCACIFGQIFYRDTLFSLKNCMSLGFRELFVVSLLGLISTVSNADISQDTLAHQRNVFETLEKMTSKPNSAEFRRLRAQLDGYPLLPYIEQNTLKAHPYLANREKIEVFLTRYAGTPLDRPLRHSWLEHLAEKDEGALFIGSFQPTNNIELTCHNLRFMIQQNGVNDQIFAQIGELWEVGKSQPNECDPLFAQWKKAGFLTADKVLMRLSLAADGGNHTLIPYLKGLLPTEQQYLADLWLKVRRNPSFVSKQSLFPQTYSDREMDIIRYGLKRLVWRDSDQALRIWQGVQAKYDAGIEIQRDIASTFAVALAIDEHEQAEFWLEKANYGQADDQLFRWHLAHVLKRQDWQHALEVIDIAPEELASDLSYQYWRARAFEHVNAKDYAQKGYQSVASHRHYYGFLASGRLNQLPNMVDIPLQFSVEDLATVATMPAAQRAHEFFQLGRFYEARREWFYLQSQLNQTQQLVSAVLADSWGWHDRAIVGFSNTGYLDDVKRRFPMAFKEQLINHSTAYQIDPAWAFAIARRESSFMTDASSSAGARGLMQLLPGTARYLAKKKISTQILFDPNINAGYGTQYLRYLLDKMDNNPVLATASYNAGWRSVQRWLPEKGSLPMDIWIETIPYKETRNYVKAVLAYRQIYASQLGHNEGLFDKLVEMHVDGDLKK